MTTLREAAQQALEALEDIFGANKVDVGAINALRAALAEQSRAWYTIDEINAKFDPPQRKPLTDEEIYAAIKGIDSLKAVEVARAIERAHGITGPEDKGG